MLRLWARVSVFLRQDSTEEATLYTFHFVRFREKKTRHTGTFGWVIVIIHLAIMLRNVLITGTTFIGVSLDALPVQGCRTRGPGSFLPLLWY
jgi:hypothetical protein